MLPFSSIRLHGLAAGLVSWLGMFAASAALVDDRVAFFERRIRPVLAEHCYECHGAGSVKRRGGLLLDTRSGLLKGGDSGPALVPGDARRSRLLEAVGYGNRDLQMPPKGRLPDAVVADLTRWIEDGAVDPRDGSVEAGPAATPSGPKPHWAFQPIREPVVLAGSGGNPIDRFIVERLAATGLHPAPQADRRTLIRRASYDLTGLPPSPEDVRAFVGDPSPDAYSRMVDRLLASPRYGERWGRWWLDVARYADTNGQDENKVMANAWRYRDWVIRSFNGNQRFDAFITDQLAGDLLPTGGLDERAVFDRWTATGFLVLGPKMLAEQDKPKLVMDLVDEQIEVTSRAFLGLTLSCARCHDHKFDPVPARDYYALAGIFRSTKTMANLDFVSKFNERRITPPAQLAAIGAHSNAVARLKQDLEQAMQRANAELLQGWRSNLPGHLAALASGRSHAGLAIPTNSAARLLEAFNADPATNAISRVLRRLASDPSALPAFPAAGDPPTTNSGLRLAPGKAGAAFLATGHNHLELPSTAGLEPAQVTVEAWVQAAAFPSDGDTRRWLVGKNANEWAEGHYALMIDRDRAGAYLNIGGGREHVFAQWSPEHALKPGQWHHLAFTYDGATLRLFVDGKSAGETRVGRPRVPGTGPLMLARRPDGYVNFEGRLDEVRVHRRALGADEVKASYEKPGSGVSDAIVARWDFNTIPDADREGLARDETREFLFGPDGLFSLPKDPRPFYPAPTKEALSALEKERDHLVAAAPAPAAFALAVEESTPVDLPVHIRGSHLNLAKDPVPRGFVRVAFRGEPTPVPADRSGRLELARWLTSPDNPLTARVIVNRVWQAHFGEGLVRTPDNFGLRGEAPSHPELLDWLARDFMRSGWDVKRLHRLILSSRTWQQSGRGIASSPSAESADPDNRLLWCFPRQRLEAEMVRDALLAVSGRLDAAVGGTLVPWGNDDYAPDDTVSAGSVRRSVYLPVVRDRVYDVFTIFDFANPSVGTSKRTPTVVSHQALFFLNSPLVKACASEFARRLIESHPLDSQARLSQAFQSALGRTPTGDESRRSLQFIERVRNSGEPESERAAWTAWCQVLLASNEFIYLE